MNNNEIEQDTINDQREHFQNTKDVIIKMNFQIKVIYGVPLNFSSTLQFCHCIPELIQQN